MKKEINDILMKMLNTEICVGDASNELEKLFNEIEKLKREDDVQLKEGGTYIIDWIGTYIKVRIKELTKKTVTYYHVGSDLEKIVSINEFKKNIIEEL